MRRGEHDPSRSISTARLEGFSDGVFAIAATLLVLDIALHPPGTPLEQVLRAWPSYVAYVISFLTIGAAWLGHTTLTHALDRADPILLRLNLLLLLVVGFLPFPTRLVSESLLDVNGERVFVTMYGLTLLAIRCLVAVLLSYAKREHLFTSANDENQAESEEHRFWPVLVGYALAVLVGLALPEVAVAVYFGLAIYLVVPFREVGQVLFRR